MTASDGGQKAINCYLHWIEEHIVACIRDTNVKESCIATLMLLFAAMDGLGRLCHEEGNASVEKRFKAFFRRMGPEYGKKADRLYKLRCSLVHEGLSAAVVLSKVSPTEHEHLRPVRTTGGKEYLLVNTGVFFADFEAALERFRAEVAERGDISKRVAARLTADYVHHELSAPRGRVTTVTPAPLIRFIREKDAPAVK